MPKIFVALSGGVDSSVSALLLKRAGFGVKGIYMRLYDNYRGGERMAKAVAKKIGIPFLVFDFRKEFKKKVINYFLKQIKAGLTPNPCVICNEEIKFGLFLAKALKMGAPACRQAGIYVATGHYVRKLGFQDTLRSPSVLARSFPRLALPRKLGNHARSGRSVPENEFPHSSLSKAKDGNKDQSYFLWRLGQKQLSRVIFPLGNYTKPQVREIARKAGLPTAAVKESQDLCFLKNDITGFLKKNLKMKSGSIADKNGKIIGKHLGLGFYTIGQSQGFGADIFPKEQSQGPYYVLRKEAKKNLLIVTENKSDLFGKKCLVREVNWISDKAPVLPLKAMVKIRSRQTEMSAVISKTKKAGQILARFIKPQMAITPGQSAVFYRGEELIGGGIIIG